MVKFGSALLLHALAVAATLSAPAAAKPQPGTRFIRIDAANASQSVDRFFDLSVGSYYPGTPIRDDSMAQLAVATRELRFTPQALKTSDNQVFYWNGNTSHPPLDAWRDLVGALVRHLEARYGATEVRSWFFEVWNEPNLMLYADGSCLPNPINC